MQRGITKMSPTKKMQKKKNILKRQNYFFMNEDKNILKITQVQLCVSV